MNNLKSIVENGRTTGYYNLKIYHNSELFESYAFFERDESQVQSFVDKKINECKIKLNEKNELQLFIENIKKIGVQNAIIDTMKKGFKIGFHYNLMGCATIERVNKKSFTIIDICNRKNYIDEKYLKGLLFNQFYIESTITD
jgi:hypothetical protein